MILRKVSLPEAVFGQLYLSYMPGRNEPFSKAQEVINNLVNTVICLNPLEEIILKSPEYARAIESKNLDFVWEHFPLYDYGVPEDKDAFILLTDSIAARLKKGDRILIHCAGGIGRTATLAVAVLLAIGMEINTAQIVIREAGAMMQSKAQKEFITWLYKERSAVVQ